MTPIGPCDNRGVPLALAATVTACLLCLWTAWCGFPIQSWNELRLAPAFALRDGLNPYPPLGGGPLLTWIYGPVGILLNLPATLAANVTDALSVACLINFAVLCLPLAMIFLGSADLRNRCPSVRWLALSVAILLIPRLNFLFHVPDHVAIAFGLLSCWCLVRNPRPAHTRLAAAALVCTLAIWSKQVAVFLCGAQVAYLFMTGNRAAVPKYLFWLGLFNFVALGIAARAFGWANLWLNLVAIPGRLPWTEDVLARLAVRPSELACQIVLPSAGLALLRATGKWPGRNSESGRFFLITVLAFVVMLPVGFAGFLKIGGDTNLFHSWDYLLPGLLLAWFSAESDAKTTRYRALGVAACTIALRWSDVTAFPTKPFTEHYDSAETLVTSHPHRIWFPRNPLITYYADGKLWHSEDGIETRFLANYGLREVDFRRHLPPNLEGVAYPAVVEFPFSMPLLSEFDRETRSGFWTLHVSSTQGSGQADGFMQRISRE